MFVNVNDDNFTQEVLNSDIPVLVDFWAPWCGPCRMVAPVIEQIGKENEGNLKVCKVNVDEASFSASKYGVVSIPTLAVFKAGQLMEKTVGVAPKEVLIEMACKHML
jgi:thioredoxin 1